MTDLANLVLASTSLLRLLSILIALWLTSRCEPRVASLLQGEGTGRPVAAVRTLIWLALGAVLAIPLFDLVTLLQQFVELIAPARWGMADGMVTTFWGAASPRVFDALSAGTTIAVYAGSYVLIGGSVRTQGSSALGQIAPSTFDRTLLTLALAGLVNLIVTSIVVGVVFVQLPTALRPLESGTPGLVVAWFIGLLLVLALVLWMNMRVQPDDADG